MFKVVHFYSSRRSFCATAQATRFDFWLNWFARMSYHTLPFLLLWWGHFLSTPILPLTDTQQRQTCCVLRQDSFLSVFVLVQYINFSFQINKFYKIILFLKILFQIVKKFTYNMGMKTIICVNYKTSDLYLPFQFDKDSSLLRQEQTVLLGSETVVHKMPN